tara:strand:- start:46 stop:225 length:180 start_codon:yes stop_codon:yes gene_type:complete
MKKYFLGICIVIATLIYVWGNRWEVTNLHTMAAVLKYNKITGDAYISFAAPKEWIEIDD